MMRRISDEHYAEFIELRAAAYRLWLANRAGYDVDPNDRRAGELASAEYAAAIGDLLDLGEPRRPPPLALEAPAGAPKGAT